MNNKILLLASKYFPGSMSVLENLKGVLKGVIDCEIKPIELFLHRPLFSNIRVINKIETRMLRSLPPIRIKELLIYGNNIIFAGWDYRYDIILSALNKKGITPLLVLCSTLGQSELLSNELKDFIKIYDHMKNGRLKYILLNKRLYNSFGKIFPNAIYFPHTIDLHKYENIIPKQLDNINIDLFCALRPGKNVLNQILAYKMSNVNGFLHINFNNPVIDQIISLINLKVIKHKWLPAKEYYSLIAGMTASLQVTFTESFSYAICERMCLSVPCLTSYDIDLISEDKFLSQCLCVNSLDTPLVIARMLKRIIDDNELRSDLAKHSRQRIEEIANSENKYAVDYIKDIFKIN
ncbi:MAG: hypothetical protein ACPL28_09800 [bacterium]